MRTIAFAAMFLCVSVSFCQTPVTESDTLKSLLTEVHQLRQDIEAMTVASQRAQIALYALQMQDAAVTRASQRLDTVRSRCSGLEQGRQSMSAQIQMMDNSPPASMMSETESKAFESRLTALKSALTSETAQIQTCQTEEAEASSQLHNDQARLAELQDRIDRLDKSLEKLGVVAK